MVKREYHKTCYSSFLQTFRNFSKSTQIALKVCHTCMDIRPLSMCFPVFIVTKHSNPLNYFKFKNYHSHEPSPVNRTYNILLLSLQVCSAWISFLRAGTGNHSFLTVVLNTVQVRLHQCHKGDSMACTGLLYWSKFKIHFLLRFAIHFEIVEDPQHTTNPELEISVPNTMPLKYISLGPMYLRENLRPQIN